MVALDRFHTDLIATTSALDRIATSLADEGFPLSPVRILEVLVCAPPSRRRSCIRQS